MIKKVLKKHFLKNIYADNSNNFKEKQPVQTNLENDILNILVQDHEKKYIKLDEV